jgi:hypothetical protein
VAQSLINRALDDAFRANFAYAEANWYASNHRAAHFWLRYGFRPSYVRLQLQLRGSQASAESIARTSDSSSGVT